MTQSSPSHYTIHVELLDIKPTIWRRIHVDGRIRLNALHHIRQTALGWTDAHLHQFEIRNKNYGTPDPEFAELGIIDEKKYRLNPIHDYVFRSIQSDD